MNKKGSFVGLFLFIIFAFILAVVCVIFVFIGKTTADQLHLRLDNLSTAEVNYTQILTETTDKIPAGYYVLQWGSVIIIFFMVLSILISSYLVTTRPIFFVPYILISIIAIIFSAIIANAYDDLMTNPSTASLFVGGWTMLNFTMLYLPIIVSVTAIVGGIIMFASYKLVGQQDYRGMYGQQ